MMIFAIHLMGASSILGAINVIVTIMNMRAPGMTLLRMPLFVWTWLITAYLLIAVMPVLAGAVTMLLTDHFFGTTFFNAAGGGDPVMFQHIFWFFGHPEVYILILPAFGIVSEIIPTFSRKPLFGYEAMVYAIASIAFLSFIVWAHHMFTVGMPLAAQLFFMLSTMLIAIPTGVKVFNWTATMWKGSLSLRAADAVRAGVPVPVHASAASPGLMLAIVPADFQYQDTYFVVAHFHYVLVPGAIFAIMAAVYYWLPKWTGHMYDHDARQLALLAVDHLRQRAVLPAALPGPGRHAAPHPRLRRAVHRLEHGVLDRRLRLRAVAVAVPVHHLEVRARRRAAPATAPGRARTAWSGSCPRRRRITPGPTPPSDAVIAARRGALMAEACRVGTATLGTARSGGACAAARMLLGARWRCAFYVGFIVMMLVRGREMSDAQRASQPQPDLEAARHRGRQLRLRFRAGAALQRAVLGDRLRRSDEAAAAGARRSSTRT